MLASIITPRERRRTQETEAGFESVGRRHERLSGLSVGLAVWRSVCLWLLGAESKAKSNARAEGVLEVKPSPHVVQLATKVVSGNMLARWARRAAD